MKHKSKNFYSTCHKNFRILEWTTPRTTKFNSQRLHLVDSNWNKKENYFHWNPTLSTYSYISCCHWSPFRALFALSYHYNNNNTKRILDLKIRDIDLTYLFPFIRCFQVTLSFSFYVSKNYIEISCPRCHRKNALKLC